MDKIEKIATGFGCYIFMMWGMVLFAVGMAMTAAFFSIVGHVFFGLGYSESWHMIWDRWGFLAFFTLVFGSPFTKLFTR